MLVHLLLMNVIKQPRTILTKLVTYHSVHKYSTDCNYQHFVIIMYSTVVYKLKQQLYYNFQQGEIKKKLKCTVTLQGFHQSAAYRLLLHVVLQIGTQIMLLPMYYAMCLFVLKNHTVL